MNDKITGSRFMLQKMVQSNHPVVTFVDKQQMARILFVDDDPLMLETLKKAVTLFGYEAELATSGVEAEDMIAQYSFDLIFVDMSLADTDGLSLVTRFRSLPATSQIPILILSAVPGIGVVEKAKVAGAQEFLEKPIRLQTLLDVIKQYTA